MNKLGMILVIGILILSMGCNGEKSYQREIDVSAKGYNVGMVNRDELFISPDGRFAAFGAVEDSPESIETLEFQLLIADLYSGEVISLDKDEDIQILEWFPDSQKILYRKKNQLFAAKTLSKESIKLADNSFFGTVSPDGQQIAYAVQQQGIFIVETDTGSRKQVTDKKGDWHPVWYPDGKSLFYFNDLGVTLSDGAGQLQGLAKVDVETEEITPLPGHEEGKYRSAAWISPGKTLYIVKGWDDEFREIVFNTHNGTVNELIQDDRGMAFSTALDRVSGLIYKYKQEKVFVFNSEGQEMRSFIVDKPIHQDYLDNFAFSVSPDGKKLVYLFGENGYYDQEIKGRKIYMVGNDGSDIKELTDNFRYITKAQWTPDSKHIVVAETPEYQGSSNLKINILPVE